MPFPFADAVALLEGLLARRGAGVERIESRLLNVKGKDASRRRDRQYFDSALDACVFADRPREGAALREQMASAHLADGFEVMFRDTYAHQLDPAALVVRAYDYWDAHRWPGANARRVYADTIWAASVFRLLEDLSLRIWDGAADDAPRRLQDIQGLLDGLNAAHPEAGLVRDAHWLVQTAQGPITRQLAPYFRVAERIAASFPGDAGIAPHAAAVKLAGGHLRSQLRQRASELERRPEDPAVLVATRNSNAMDMALLVWDLVPLLEAYTGACRHENAAARLELAGAIVQGCSADPELLLTRLDLLAPITMIETVFVHVGDGGPALTPAGARHVTLLERYRALVGGAAPALARDAAAFVPDEGGYSPLGLVYGFCADLLSKMALDSLHGRPARGVTLEDLFAACGSPETRRRVDGWSLEYSPSWDDESRGRVASALAHRAAHPGRANASATPAASLRIVAAGATEAGAADHAQDYLVTSDVSLALATGATAFPRSQFVSDRNEGRFLASAEVDGKWFGISKAVLTERIALGKNAVSTGVPRDVKEILQITCPNLLR